MYPDGHCGHQPRQPDRFVTFCVPILKYVAVVLNPCVLLSVNYQLLFVMWTINPFLLLSEVSNHVCYSVLYRSLYVILCVSSTLANDSLCSSNPGI